MSTPPHILTAPEVEAAAVDSTHFEQLLNLAISEDIGSGDVTTSYFIKPDLEIKAFMVARSEGYLAGVQAAKATFHKIDPDLDIRILLDTGAHVASGAHILSVKGNASSILQAERIALNFVQKLSGIASETAHYVNAIRDTHAQVLDTRKTTPGYRALEKAAVLAGGGQNHRHGLYDRAMLKDNHLATFSDSHTMQQNINRLHQERPDIKIQIEADSLAQVAEYLNLQNVDYLLLDNMNTEMLRQAVGMRGDKSRPLLEASGGVNLSTIREIAQTGVDYISVGAITHSSPALDIGLDYQAEEF